MTWSEWGVIVLAGLLVLTWLWGALCGDEVDSEILGLRRDLVHSTTDVGSMASTASQKASEARMEAMKANDRVNDLGHDVNEIGVRALMAERNAKRANGRLDDIHCPASDWIERHEEKFHPNELKRLELQQQSKETEAQAARKAINPELI